MRILLAEDDPATREGLTRILESEGYTVLAAPDGVEALRVFELEQPDFALLDVMMPGMDGYALCRELLRRRPGLPVIFVSARSEEIDRVVGLELGADDFIIKPFGVREVIARIRAVTRRTLAAQSAPPSDDRAPFVLGDLQVLPAELRARRGEQVLDLSLREVCILRLLYQHRGEVVDRQTLFNRCWGMDYLPSSRTLDQQISKLRRRVERTPRRPEIIRTVHGVGYRYDG